MLALASFVGNVSGAVDLQSLVANPPFGSKATQTTAADPAQALEFRGTFVDGNERFFSIHETATRFNQWVGLKEASQPFLVESYDSDKGSIQVKYRNQVMTLTLKLAQIIVQAAPVTPASPSSPTSLVGTNPTPVDEAKRLAQVAEEIRRRRALRSPGPVPQQQATNMPFPTPGPSTNMPVPTPGPSTNMPFPAPGPSTTMPNSGPGPGPAIKP